MIVNPLVPATPPGDFIIIQPKPLKHRGEQPNPGTVLGVDEWEAVCKDRNAYSISILVEPDETTITSLTWPGVAGDEQEAIAQGWQQEQSGRLSDQVSGPAPMKADARA